MTFNASTTATEVAQLFSSQITSKSILITGCSPGGIGAASALALARHAPALLILSGRSQFKLDTVASEIHAAVPNTLIRTHLMDLDSLASVRKAAAEVNSWQDVPRIEILINNAGVMAIPTRQLTEGGIEAHFGTNHIGHFLFTNLILPKLKAASASSTASTPPPQVRIINLSSLGYKYSPIRFSDPNFLLPTNTTLPTSEQPGYEMLKWRQETIPENTSYQRMIAYGQSKTANILFSVALNYKLSGAGIQSFAIHPGAVLSAGGVPHIRELPEHVKPMVKSPDQGAASVLVAALDPGLSLKDGVYLSDCQMMEVEGFARDEGIAERLWGMSEGMVGEKFEL